jgi:hypothetical protein
VQPAVVNLGMRYFYAWKKYPYESMALLLPPVLANNLIHTFCAELHRRTFFALELAGKSW